MRKKSDERSRATSQTLYRPRISSRRWASATTLRSCASRGCISCAAWANISSTAAPGRGTDDEIWLACRVFLENAYNDFVASSPIEQRVFKVLKDAVKPKEEPQKPFVALSTLTVAREPEKSKSL